MNDVSEDRKKEENLDTERTLLIVDDAVVNRIILKKIFCQSYGILQAADGEEALQILTTRNNISGVILDLNMPKMDGFQVMARMKQQERLSSIPVIVVTGEVEAEIQNQALDFGALDVITKPFHAEIILHRVKHIIERQEMLQLKSEMQCSKERLYLSTHDGLTGLYNRFAFVQDVKERMLEKEAGSYVISCINIDGFKVLNERYGHDEGDRLLKHIGALVKEEVEKVAGLACRDMADLFFTLLPNRESVLNKTADILRNSIALYNPSMNIRIHIGYYVMDDLTLDVNQMADRALLAVRSIRNNAEVFITGFSEEMQKKVVRNQELLSDMKKALQQNEFSLFFQPQFDSGQNCLCGAEVLARWMHHEKGMISPVEFIPLFEQNNCIGSLDLYIWEEACKQMRKWIDEGFHPPHISVNISRRDILGIDLVLVFTELLKKYQLAPELIHLEITESAYVDNPQQLIEVVEQLQEKGFLIEMDDFGSGYSSLNTLKDVPVDILKLDMRFSENAKNTQKSGSILSSVVRMADWLNLPVIAEGVETRQQADFLKSIGCVAMQGYLYSKPVSVSEFEAFLSGNAKREVLRGESESFQSDLNFLDMTSQASLMFNHYAGAAMILEYDGESVEALRVNEKFYEVIGSSFSEFMKFRKSILSRLVLESRPVFLEALRKTLETKQETVCEISCFPLRENDERHYARVYLNLLRSNQKRSHFYMMIESTTTEKKLRAALSECAH